MKEDNPLITASSSESSGDRTTLKFVKTQLHISWTLVIFHSIACLVFILFFVLIVNTQRAGNIFAYAIAFAAYVAIAGVSIYVLIWFNNNQGLSYNSSSPWIFVLCVIRCTEYMTMMISGSDNALLEGIEALTGSWGFFFCLLVTNTIVREYFGEPEAHVQVPRLPQPDTFRPSTSAHKHSRGFVFSRSPDRGLSTEETQRLQERVRRRGHTLSSDLDSGSSTSATEVSDLFLKAIFICCILMSILVLLPPTSAWVALFVKLSSGVTITKHFKQRWVLIIRPNSLKWIVGMAARAVLDGLELLWGVDLLHYSPNENASGFLSFAKETITEVFPLVLHFFNIISMRRGLPAKPARRLKYLLYAVLVHLHFVTIAYVEESTASESFGVLLASTAGYLAALDTAILLLIILTPISHLFYPIFNFGILRAAIHKLHLHRRLAYSASFFALVHVFVHFVTWAATPYSKINGELIYSLRKPYLYTGVLMVIGYCGAIYSGRNPTSKLSYHLPFSALAFLAFSVHGSGGVLGTPFGDYIIVGVIATSAIIISFFFAFHPTHRAEIDLQRSACVHGLLPSGREAYFLVLVVQNPTRQPVMPGSLFNIYDKRGGAYSYFHSQPFPVFSSSPRRLVFFIQCRNTKQEDRPSFTKLLYKNVDSGEYKHLQLQGPLCASSTVSSSFIQHLVGLPKKIDVYLCGADSGFANVFSMLEHLKGNCHMYNIQAIYCTYHILEEKVRQTIHEYVDELVENWNNSGEVPLTVIEVSDLLASVKILSENSRVVIANSQREDGETAIVDMWTDKFKTVDDGESAVWVAVGKDAYDNKHTKFYDDEWEDVDGNAARKKGKGKGKDTLRSEEASSGAEDGTATKAMYACGIELDYEYFSENWKIFNELTSPSYKLPTSSPAHYGSVAILPQMNYTPTAQDSSVSYQSQGSISVQPQ